MKRGGTLEVSVPFNSAFIENVHFDLKSCLAVLSGVIA
jgi:hypothetical protein